MSDEKEFGLTNEGTDGVVQVPVETKEPTLNTPAPVEKKKRGRPAKKTVEEEKPEKIWYCSTCRETISDSNVMRIGAGENRCAVFCPQCQRSFGFEDKVMHDKVAEFIKNNPTGK